MPLYPSKAGHEPTANRRVRPADPLGKRGHNFIERNPFVKTNLNNLEAVAAMLETLALAAEREGKPFQWKPWATVRNAAKEIEQLRRDLAIARNQINRGPIPLT